MKIAKTTMALLKAPADLHKGGPKRQTNWLTATANIYPGMLLYKSSATQVTESNGEHILFGVAGVALGHDYDTVYAAATVIPVFEMLPGCVVAVHFADQGGTKYAGSSVLDAGSGVGTVAADDTKMQLGRLHEDVVDDDTRAFMVMA